MPAPPLSNTFNGGTVEGQTITAGNSGGLSGNAFGLFSATVPIFTQIQRRGPFAMSVGPTTTLGSVGWSGMGIGGGVDLWARVYLYLAALPTGVAIAPIRFQTVTSAVSGGLSIDVAGKIRPFNAAGAGVGTIGTVTVATNQWVRLEVRIRSDTAAGQIEWRLYNSADSTSITETKSETGLVLGAGTDWVTFGSVSSSPTPPFTVYVEDVAVSATDWLGPAPFAGFTNSVVPTVTGALAVGGTLTISNGTWTPTPSSYQYYWHRADDALGTNLVEIGATGSTYTLSSSDLTKYIRAGVIPVQ